MEATWYAGDTGGWEPSKHKLDSEGFIPRAHRHRAAYWLNSTAHSLLSLYCSCHIVSLSLSLVLFIFLSWVSPPPSFFNSFRLNEESHSFALQTVLRWLREIVWAWVPASRSCGCQEARAAGSLIHTDDKVSVWTN